MAQYVYAFLVGEMAKKHLTSDSMGKLIGINGRTMRNKLNGITDFTWGEVCKIHEILPEFPIERIFQKES